MGFESIPKQGTPEEIKKAESHMTPLQKKQTRGYENVIDDSFPRTAKASHELGISISEVEKMGIKADGWMPDTRVKIKNFRGHTIDIIADAKSGKKYDSLDAYRLGPDYINFSNIAVTLDKDTAEEQKLKPEDAKAFFDRYQELICGYLEEKDNISNLDMTNARIRRSDERVKQDHYFQTVQDLMR